MGLDVARRLVRSVSTAPIGVNAGFLVGHSAVRRVGDGRELPRAGDRPSRSTRWPAWSPRPARRARSGSPRRPRRRTTTPTASPCRRGARDADELVALWRPRCAPCRARLSRRSSRAASTASATTTRDLLGRMSIAGPATAELERPRRLHAQPRRARDAARGFRPRRRLAAADVVALDAPAHDADPPLLPHRVSCSTALPGWREVLSLPVPDPHAGARRPGGADAAGATGPTSDEAGVLRGAGRLAQPRGRRGVRARERGRSRDGRSGHRHRARSAPTPSTCCSTSCWPTGSAPACGLGPTGRRRGRLAAPRRGVARPAYRHRGLRRRRAPRHDVRRDLLAPRCSRTACGSSAWSRLEEAVRAPHRRTGPALRTHAAGAASRRASPPTS